MFTPVWDPVKRLHANITLHLVLKDDVASDADVRSCILFSPGIDGQCDG